MREPDQNVEEYRARQAAILRLQRQSSLGEHGSPVDEPCFLAATNGLAHRPDGTGLGREAVAIQAIRDRRETHHSCPAKLAARFRAGPGNWHDHQDPSQHRRTQTPPKKASIAGLRHPRPAPATPCTTPTETWKPTPTRRQQGQRSRPKPDNRPDRGSNPHRTGNPIIMKNPG